MKSSIQLLSASLIAATISCSGESPGLQDTRTNWLRACDVNAECGSELACVCNICTVTCQSSDECDGGQCSSPLAAAEQCQSEGAVAPICMATEDAGECASWTLPVDNDLGQGDANECENEGDVLCENFDDPIPEWMSIWEGGPASIQECETFEGAGALRFEGASLQMRMPFDGVIAEGTLYLRAHVLLTEDAEFNANVMTMFSIRHQREGDIEERMALNALPDGALELAAFSNEATQTYFESEPGQLPRGEWACIVMGVQVDDADGTVEISVDETPALTEVGMDTRGPDPFEMLVVTNGQGLTRGEFYVDNLTVSTSPLGCGSP